jgi:Flp pilus assembly protein TadG
VRGRLGRRPRRDHESGQSLVEFALVFPIFILLIIGLVEFSVMFSIMLNVNFASRDAALLAAELGDQTGGDCAILAKVDSSMSAITNKDEVQEVRIFQSDANGAELAANVYSRGGSTTCVLPGGVNLTVPYTQQSATYPEAQRCTIVLGCGGSHPTLDTIGVAIEFHHTWLTPLPNLVQVEPFGVTFQRSNAMRMEPEL